MSLVEGQAHREFDIVNLDCQLDWTETPRRLVKIISGYFQVQLDYKGSDLIIALIHRVAHSLNGLLEGMVELGVWGRIGGSRFPGACCLGLYTALTPSYTLFVLFSSHYKVKDLLCHVSLLP